MNTRSIIKDKHHIFHSEEINLLIMILEVNKHTVSLKVMSVKK